MMHSERIKKEIYIEDMDGILHYYGNPVGYTDGDKVVIDSIFDKQDRLDYIEREIGKPVEKKEGIFRSLTEGQFQYGSQAKVRHLGIKIYQLIPNGHFNQSFVSLFERRDKGLGEPSRDEYRVSYEGEIEKLDLEDIWDRFSRFVSKQEGAHALSISDIVELTDGENSRCFYVDRYGFTEIEF